MLKHRALLLISLMVATGMFSCVPTRKLSYVQSDDDLPPSQMIFTGQLADNSIRPGDEIYVRITSADEQPTALTGEMQRVYDATLSSYTVDDDGSIRLPYVGKINLFNLTLEQAAEKTEAALSQYLFLPNVYMRFINTRVTVLGEVNQPGVYAFDYKNISILQAIGYARDITDFGNRQNVLLIRDDGLNRSKHFIDLTRDDLFESEFYTLQSGDIIFIEPMKRKVWGLTTVPYNLILTVITTGLVVYNFFN